MLNSKCENCIHEDVCIHVDSYKHALVKLRDAEENYTELVAVDVKCKCYRSDVQKRSGSYPWGSENKLIRAKEEA